MLGLKRYAPSMEATTTDLCVVFVLRYSLKPRAAQLAVITILFMPVDAIDRAAGYNPELTNYREYRHFTGIG